MKDAREARKHRCGLRQGHPIVLERVIAAVPAAPAKGRNRRRGGGGALLQPRPLGVRDRVGWGSRASGGCAGLSGSAATATHLGAVWGSEQVMLPALGLTPPLTEWGAKEVAIDALHHLVHAGATGVAYSLLDR